MLAGRTPAYAEGYGGRPSLARICQTVTGILKSLANSTARIVLMLSLRISTLRKCSKVMPAIGYNWGGVIGLLHDVRQIWSLGCVDYEEGIKAIDLEVGVSIL